MSKRNDEFEATFLSPFATKSSETKGRLRPTDEYEIRTPFQRDCDRIIHSKSFRRLMHKTQVFIAPEGDHFRTRLTHTLEVSRIARTMARGLQLNEDLTEAISLAHDLGHTPFGHSGERALAYLNPNGFSHSAQSLRVVDKLENSGQGLNLTFEVRDGIAKHTGVSVANTLEGRLVKLADRIAYINHDIDDAVRAGIIEKSDIPMELSKALGQNHGERINTMVLSVIKNGVESGVGFTEPIGTLTENLRDFMFEKVYRNEKALSEEDRITRMLTIMYSYFKEKPDLLPTECISCIESDGIDTAVCDYIAGMTDRYAIAVFDGIFVPRSWAVGTQ